MVGLLTFGKKKFESVDDLMRKTIGPLHDNLQAMLPLVDKDSDAFTEYMVREGDGIEGEKFTNTKKQSINHSHTLPSLPSLTHNAPSLVL